jgi:hypothetical protein
MSSAQKSTNRSSFSKPLRKGIDIGIIDLSDDDEPGMVASFNDVVGLLRRAASSGKLEQAAEVLTRKIDVTWEPSPGKAVNVLAGKHITIEVLREAFVEFDELRYLVSPVAEAPHTGGLGPLCHGT